MNYKKIKQKLTKNNNKNNYKKLLKKKTALAKVFDLKISFNLLKL